MNNLKTTSGCRTACALVICLTLAAVSSVSAQQRMAVSGDVANVRSGPGTEYERLWQVERNTPIRVLDSEKGWYFFEDFEGTRGWI
ncbi:MAG: SH3 domain-containing protein, partial [Desulfosalsimonas sp.]